MLSFVKNVSFDSFGGCSGFRFGNISMIKRYNANFTGEIFTKLSNVYVLLAFALISSHFNLFLSKATLNTIENAFVHLLHLSFQQSEPGIKDNLCISE